MPLQATSGAASYDAFGGGVAVVPNYIEDVFSTYLYIGAGATQTITNGIDLSGKGGLVWTKARSSVSGAPTYYTHELTDTVRGANNGLTTSTTAPQSSSDVNGFTSTGFNLTVSTGRGNAYDINEVSWTFREQPKFFDVQTWTGDGTSYRDIAHSLNSVPACMIVKVTSTTGDWFVYHKNLASDQYYLKLNTTAAQSSASSPFDLPPTSTVFTVGYNGVNSLNTSGATYVAYLFAHNAGGFGLTGTDNVISCGSFTTGAGGAASVTLGYEPQWVIAKTASEAGGWHMFDNMRGMPVGSADAVLFANTSAAEVESSRISPTATGFDVTWPNGTADVIYIAIRRGPMKVPTSGTSVFSPIAYVGANGAAQNISAGFPVDMDIIKIRNDASRDPLNHARLMGGVFLATDTTGAQQSYSDNIVSFNNAQNVIGLPVTGGGTNEINGASSSTYIGWAMRRAPSFMDVVCTTGNGSYGYQSHNLTVQPELYIQKRRNGTRAWTVATSVAGGKSGTLNTTDALSTDTFVSLYTTATQFIPYWDSSGETYVNYFFATCAGVSKVGSYTGNGSSQTINCGFTGGARFVLIKRTDASGDWMISDSARGIVSGSDPYLELNNTNAEVTGEDWLDTDSTGFVVNEVSGSNANTSSATYIFLAIA